MIEEGLTALLKADAGIQAALAGGVFPVEGLSDKPVYPYCAYRNISSRHSNTTDGAEMSAKTIQFDIFSKTYLGGKKAIQALRNLLVPFLGALPDGTRLLIVTRGNEIDNFASAQSGADRIYHSFAEYEFAYVET